MMVTKKLCEEHLQTIISLVDLLRNNALDDEDKDNLRLALSYLLEVQMGLLVKLKSIKND